MLQGGQGSAAMALDAVGCALGALETLVPEAAGYVAASTSTTTLAAATADPAAKARMQGYEGEACGECGNYTLVRNGTCMKCNTCGGTSGCS